MYARRNVNQQQRQHHARPHGSRCLAKYLMSYEVASLRHNVVPVIFQHQLLNETEMARQVPPAINLPDRQQFDGNGPLSPDVGLTPGLFEAWQANSSTVPVQRQRRIPARCRGRRSIRT
jgi:hypothetical protein